MTDFWFLSLEQKASEPLCDTTLMALNAPRYSKRIIPTQEMTLEQRKGIQRPDELLLCRIH